MLQLLILLLTVFDSTTSECPTMCTCRHYPRETIPENSLYYSSVKCDGFQPKVTISNATRVLELWHLNASEFGDVVLTLSEANLPELNRLIVKHSSISNISGLINVFSDNRVIFLTFSYSNLTRLPDRTDNVRVISLDYSHNKLEVLTSLNTLRTVETLNLSENLIRIIYREAFQNFTNLKILDLSKNYLTSLDEQVLTPLTSLQHLNLSSNSIQILKDNTFRNLLKLQQLDLSRNKLLRMSPECLRLPILTRLVLAENSHLGQMHPEILLGVCQRVHSVDVSGMGLKQVPAVLTHSIRTLKLARNSIRTITCGELDGYPLLQLLDLTSNSLTSIEEDAMGRQESLKILYLSDNNLGSIPRSLPESLNLLHLQRNAIQKISREDFEGLIQLEMLLLNDNKIIQVEGGAFRHLRALVTLDLSRNPIKSLYPGSLSGPSALQYLRLSEIDAIFPAKDVSFPLPGTDHLVRLDISKSPWLARQYLADAAALAASKNLQELDISRTDLEFIRSDLLIFLPQLTMMHLQDNPLNCTDLQWLAKWMRRQDHPKNRDIVCASPAELWGTLLVDLQEVEPVINYSVFKMPINLKAAEKSGPSGKYVSVPIRNKNSSEAGTENNPQSVHKNTVISEGIEGKNAVMVIDDPRQAVKKSVNKTFISGRELTVSSLVSRDKEYLTGTSAMLQDRHRTDSAPAEDTKTRSSDTRSSINVSARVFNKSSASVKPATGPNERIFNDTSSLTGSNKGESGMTPPANMTDIMAEWNASTAKSSMYRNDEASNTLLHPSMLILAVGVIGGAISLVTLAVRFNTKKRECNAGDSLNEGHEEIPVSSISSVTELW